MFTGLLAAIDNRFYFGIGGMGDFLLLMSTFYDDIKQDEMDVVFVANNRNNISTIAKKFPKIRRWWIYPRPSFNASPMTWTKIRSHSDCCGTGVTPRDFNYVGDWIKCGETNVFRYYGVCMRPLFARPDPRGNYNVVQPFGGADDATKKKEIPEDAIFDIVNNSLSENRNTVFIGSVSDKAKMMAGFDGNNFGTYWEHDICEVFDLILDCHEFHGADSWGKTLAAMAGKETYVYPNQYSEGKTPMDLFGREVDPGDHVFLQDWGFIMVDKNDT